MITPPLHNSGACLNGANPSEIVEQVLSERETRRLLAGTTTFSLTPPAQVRKRRAVPNRAVSECCPPEAGIVWASISLRRLDGRGNRVSNCAFATPAKERQPGEGRSPNNGINLA